MPESRRSTLSSSEKPSSISDLVLRWHSYKYFPYEKDFALREVEQLVGPSEVVTHRYGLTLKGALDTNELSRKLDRLVYFSEYGQGGLYKTTLQSRLESSCSVTGDQRKQTTRYSIHGLHDYRGKFNPQVVRGIFNGLGIGAGSKVLDPFCGSGTTLVESAYAGVATAGTDMNPLAVFISNAKVQALAVPALEMREALRRVLRLCHDGQSPVDTPSSEARTTYLRKWFDKDILEVIERLRSLIEQEGTVIRDALLVVASDLLRAYSRQEPSDLRIRRRFSPMHDEPFLSAFEKRSNYVADNLEAAQVVTGLIKNDSRAHLLDNRFLSPRDSVPVPPAPYEAALTSPPYATALPYIDTQRLSLVWLGLCGDDELKALEAGLIGSREFQRGEKNEWGQRLADNTDSLTEEALSFCCTLNDALSEKDGFRRQAVPSLLYRYLVSMRDMFVALLPMMAPGAPFALVVGHNRTTLSGTLFDIDTPALLKAVAEDAGWSHSESVELQTYQRYDLHQKNSVKAETLLLLTKPQGQG